MTIHEYMEHMERKSVRAATPPLSAPHALPAAEERPSSRGSSRAHSRQGITSPGGTADLLDRSAPPAGVAPTIDLWGPARSSALAAAPLARMGGATDGGGPVGTSIPRQGGRITPPGGQEGREGRSQGAGASGTSEKKAAGNGGRADANRSDLRPGSAFHSAHAQAAHGGGGGLNSTAPVVATDLSSLSPDLFTPKSFEGEAFEEVLPEAPLSPLGLRDDGWGAVESAGGQGMSMRRRRSYKGAEVRRGRG